MVALSSFYPLIQLHLRRNIFSPVSNIFNVSTAILAALDIITTATRRCRAAAPSRDRRHGAGGGDLHTIFTRHRHVCNVHTRHRYTIFRLLCGSSHYLTRVNKDRTICPRLTLQILCRLEFHIFACAILWSPHLSPSLAPARHNNNQTRL